MGLDASSGPQPVRLKAGKRPMWSVTEDEAEAMEAAEEDCLLEFADQLDIDALAEQLSDAELAEAIRVWNWQHALLSTVAGKPQQIWHHGDCAHVAGTRLIHFDPVRYHCRSIASLLIVCCAGWFCTRVMLLNSLRLAVMFKDAFRCPLGTVHQIRPDAAKFWNITPAFPSAACDHSLAVVSALT